MRTELVEAPVTTYAALPAVLTDPLPEPAPPPWRCMLRGAPTVCALDALIWIESWRALRARANEDRTTSARITEDAADAPRLTGRDAGARP